MIDSIISSPIGRNFIAKFTSSGSIHAFAYSKSNRADLSAVSVCFYDNSGNVSKFSLSSTSGNGTIFESCLVKDRLIVSSKSPNNSNYSQTVIDEYKLDNYNNNGLPTSSSFIKTLSFGDVLTRQNLFVNLSNGKVASLSLQHDKNIRAYTAIRNLDGNWYTSSRMDLLLTSSIPQTYSDALTWGVAEHPSDKSIWAFVATDGGHRIDAIKMVELNNSLKVINTFPRYINDNSNNGIYQWGPMVPYGEIPDVQAISDPFRNQIVISYAGNTGKLIGNMSNSQPVIAKINSLGTASLVMENTDLSPANLSPIGIYATPTDIGSFYTNYEIPNISLLKRKIWKNGIPQTPERIVETQRQSVFSYSPVSADVGYVDPQTSSSLSPAVSSSVHLRQCDINPQLPLPLPTPTGSLNVNVSLGIPSLIINVFNNNFPVASAFVVFKGKDGMQLSSFTNAYGKCTLYFPTSSNYIVGKLSISKSGYITNNSNVNITMSVNVTPI